MNYILIYLLTLAVFRNLNKRGHFGGIWRIHVDLASTQ